MPPSLNYVQRRESNPRDALLQLYLTERNRAAVIKLNINNRNTNFLISFLAATSNFFLHLTCVGTFQRNRPIDHYYRGIDRGRHIPHHDPLRSVRPLQYGVNMNTDIKAVLLVIVCTQQVILRHHHPSAQLPPHP